jgi:hypothetical protein
VVTVYLLLLALVLWSVYSNERQANVDPFGGLMATQTATVGRNVFEALLAIMFLLLMFLVPAITSGAISGERERQTMVPLQITLLRPRQIVTGKLTASIAFLLLLLVASVPLLSVAYLLGGMSFGQVLMAVVGLVFVGVVFASVTVCCSALFRRTQTATVMAYLTVFVMTVGPFIGWGIWSTVGPVHVNDRPPHHVLMWNPAVFYADVVEADADALQQGPWTGLAGVLDPPLEDDFVRFQEVGGPEIVMDENGEFVAMNDGPFGFVGDPEELRNERTPFWKLSTAALTLVIVLALAIASRRVRTPAKVER